MKKTINIIIIIITIIIGYKNTPSYNELNNVKIIDKIIFNKNDITLREKYLTKKDNIVKYEYKYYHYKSKKLKEICKKKKNFYIEKAKYIYK